jgi:hypothetical protein
MMPMTLTNQGGWLVAFDILEIDFGTLENGGNSSRQGTKTPGWYEATPIPEAFSAYAPAQCPDDPDGFYLVGGQENLFTPVDSLWRYDVDTSLWTELVPIPQPIGFASATCYDGKIYLAGGVGQNGFELSSLYVYDIASHSWAQKANMPRATVGSALGAWNGHLYRWAGQEFMRIELIYDILNNSWFLGGAPMPQPTCFLVGHRWVTVVHCGYLLPVD